MANNVGHTDETVKEKIIETLRRSFLDDAAINYLLNRTHAEGDAFYTRHKQMFIVNVGLHTYNTGDCYEVADYQAAALWLPPGKKLDNPIAALRYGPTIFWHLGYRSMMKMLDYSSYVDPVKAKYLKGRPYYYCFIVGTLPEHRGKGHCKALFKEHLEKGDRLPLWLEATSENSRDIYKKMGFEVLETVVMGVGQVDGKGYSDGETKEGVTLWCMLREPRDEKTDSK
ncbi:hypothetical protein PROFUN_14084 [Planoprotostelium fungivorum]|uniref:N-acetyltransferase domain-containing protein n=1 Tax=Planoprotostelium fungivorum TaxID=1890364 RepID=A0A2P6N210_9EUKA|nr:hypothetical protein PROFUN_14084 [Planoprotostelium fungivorum]